MEYIFKLIELINSAQLVAIGIMLWFFYNRLDSKIEKSTQRIDEIYRELSEKIDTKIEQLEQKLNQRIDSIEQKLTQRIDNVYALIINLFQIKRIDDLSNNQDKAA